MKRLLVQVQLSNYDTKGKWILECDSGYQMVFGRVRELLKHLPDVKIDVLLPKRSGFRTQPESINPDLPWGDRLFVVEVNVVPNALATRYNFNVEETINALKLRTSHYAYDAVYVNDPMHLRNLKAAFHLGGRQQPKFYVHSHFVDVPSCPKFPTDASLWLGQCEAAVKADWNFWQCESAMREFEVEARKIYRDEVVDDIMKKSSPWDDGYSYTEITSPPNMSNVRFDPDVLNKLSSAGKKIIFVPNRIGGLGRSSDYTNCGKFMFEILPKLREARPLDNDYVVIAGNPSQKILNSELQEMCGKWGYVNLVPDALTRDEFKVVARCADVAVGLYDKDTYGGTAARECIELGCLPLWIDVNEYSKIAREASASHLLAKPDFSDLHTKLSYILDHIDEGRVCLSDVVHLRSVVRQKCSYESTTARALKVMNSLA